MKILIVGGRDFNNYDLFLNILEYYKHDITSIISGGASGADSLAEKFATYYGIDITVIKPDWNIGKSAGIIRNSKMIDMNPDMVIAFWDGKSKGTKDTIKKAYNKKIDTLIIYY